MSGDVQVTTRDEVQLELQALSELVSYLGHADTVMHSDQREWYRNLIRALAELTERAKHLEIELTADAVFTKSLNVTEVSRAAKLTRASVYNRVGGKFPDASLQ